MTDTPDLRTLAAEADAIRARLDQARKVYERESDCDDMPEHANGLLLALDVTISDADRLLAHVDRLAAVLPAHRRQVLTEAAVAAGHEIRAELVCCDVYDRDQGTPRAGRDHAICFWGEAGARLAEGAIQELASAAPETAPTPRHGDETAPAVPQATPEPAAGDTAGRADAHPLMLRSGNWCCGCGWYAGSADGRKAVAEHAAHVAARRAADG